jgi:hypothetical protein
MVIIYEHKISASDLRSGLQIGVLVGYYMMLY